MSYQLKEIIVHSHIDEEWTVTTIAYSGQTLSQLLSSYTGVVVVLTRAGVIGDFYFDLFHNQDWVYDITQTLNQWLISIEEGALPVTNSPPYRVFRYVNFRDAGLANYNWRLCAKGRTPDAPAADGELEDLIIVRNLTDYTTMAKYCMVTVNGLFHYTSKENYGLRIHDGGSSSYVANDTTIGVYSWAGVGKIDLIPITSNMVVKTEPTVGLNNKARINIGKNVAGKSVCLVIGGYLHVLDSIVTLSGNSVIVDVAKLQLPQRVFDGLRRCDLQHSVKNFEHDIHWHTSVSNLLSDEFILDYLTISQSFIVVVDTPVLYKNREPIRNTEIGNTYSTKTKPLLPLVTAMGRMSEYVPIRKGDHWLLHAADPYYPNFKFLHSEWRKETTIEGSLVSNDPLLHANGHFLKVYSETLSLVP